MSNKRVEQTKADRIAKKTGLYVSLFICIVALLLGFWSAVNRTTKLASQNVTAIRTEEKTTEKATVKEKIVYENEQTTQKQTEKATASKKGTTTKNAVASFFVMPVGGEVIKGFSDSKLQYSKTYLDWRIHKAVDIAASKGTKVYTSGNGKVLDVYEDSLLGNCVKIDHGNNIIAYYCGLNNATVKKGDVVEVGKTIGGIGEITDESADEYHLHFAVQKDDKWVDPIKTLKITNY